MTGDSVRLQSISPAPGPPVAQQAPCYEIRVRGHLNGKWSDWLEGLEVELLANGEMALSGPVADQAALMGLLIKLNRLNLTLVSVNVVNCSR